MREMAAGEGAAALRHLVLMVREEQILPAAMDVELLAEILPRHGGALDMPAGAATAPGAVPARRLAVGGFPEHEIARIALIGRDLDAGTGQHLLWIAAREPPVLGIGRDGEEHMPLRRIGIVVGDQPLDDRDHLGDRLGRARLVVRRRAVQRRHVGMEIRRRARGDGGDGLARLARARVDLVIHVRDVADIGDAREGAAQEARQHVEDDDRPRIAEMREVIDRRAADIDADVSRVDRREVALAPLGAVMELDLHQPKLIPPRR